MKIDVNILQLFAWLLYISYSGKYRVKLGGLEVFKKSAKICYNLLHNVDITVRSRIIWSIQERKDYSV